MQAFLLVVTITVGTGSGEKPKDVGRVSLNASPNQEWELVEGSWGQWTLAKEEAKLVVHEGRLAHFSLDYQFGPDGVFTRYQSAVRVHPVTGLLVFPDSLAHSDARCLRINLPPVRVVHPVNGIQVGGGDISLVFKRVK